MIKYIIRYILFRDCDAYAKTMSFIGTPEALERKIHEMENNDCYNIEVSVA